MEDPNSSDGETEITCDLQLIQSEEKELDWSISGISAASGFDPYAYHSEVSSSHQASPEKAYNDVRGYRNQSERESLQQASEDLKKLVGNVKDIEFNLAGISKMSISPRREKTRRESDFDPEEGPNTPKNRTSNIDTTPPVRDPGPGSDTVIKQHKPFVQSGNVQISKLDQMKNTLKHLEEARKKYNNSASKIPRRSLSFTESTAPTSRAQSSAEGGSTQDLTKTSTAGSSRSTTIDTRTIQTSKSDPDTDKTVIENTIRSIVDDPLQRGFDGSNNELLDRLNQEVEKRRILETELERLQNFSKSQETELNELKSAHLKKEQLLLELKNKWTECALSWTHQLQQSQNEVARLKAENQAAKEQFLVCEEELCKALTIASEFKQKIDDEEFLKQDILTQLLAEKSTKNNLHIAEQEKSKQLREENHRLQQDFESLKKLENEVRKNYDILKETFEKTLAVERAKNSELANWQTKAKQYEMKISDLQNELKTTQTSLHTFYASQMESIMTEKIEHLQENVEMWEKTLNQEKQTELEKVKRQHQEQMENVGKKYTQAMSDLKTHSEELEASLNAARREADALRDQLKIQKRHKPMTTTATSNALPGHANNELDWSSLLLQQNIPRLHNNLCLPSTGSHPIRKSVLSSTDDEESSARPVRPSRQRPVSASNYPMIMNNQRPDQQYMQDSKRPLSALPSSGVQLRSWDYSEAKVKSVEQSFDGSCSVMSPGEKKDVVTSFIRQFLLDHPESVLDTSFLSSLNEMACKLIQESFRAEESEGYDENSSRKSGSESRSVKSRVTSGSIQGQNNFTREMKYVNEGDRKKAIRKPTWK